MYTSNSAGSGCDPDEIKTIANLVPGAAAAYDYLEAESMKNEVGSMKKEIESLRTQLAETQIQPA